MNVGVVGFFSYLAFFLGFLGIQKYVGHQVFHNSVWYD